jgi:para-nitrobenzyl esterase
LIRFVTLGSINASTTARWPAKFELPGDRRSAFGVSHDMQSRWQTFARTGTPGPGWPAYTEPNWAVMIFGRKPCVESDPAAARRLAWQEFNLAV